MAMPRPSGRAQQIASEVIPGLRSRRASAPHKETEPRASLSEVEIKQTNQITKKDK